MGKEIAGEPKKKHANIKSLVKDISALKERIERLEQATGGREYKVPADEDNVTVEG